MRETKPTVAEWAHQRGEKSTIYFEAQLPPDL
jgi:hypothetical protein